MVYQISQANLYPKTKAVDSLYQKLLILIQICCRYLKISQGSVFWDTVYRLLRFLWSVEVTLHQNWQVTWWYASLPEDKSLRTRLRHCVHIALRSQVLSCTVWWHQLEPLLHQPTIGSMLVSTLTSAYWCFLCLEHCLLPSGMHVLSTVDISTAHQRFRCLLSHFSTS